MMRKVARTDSNHSEIAAAFELIGWSVLDIHQLPKSADLLVGKWGLNIVIEVKDGNKPPSRRKLTEHELKFKESWNGDYRIVTCIQDVINLDAEYKNKLVAK